ncbi:MAG: hypothetical protein ACYCSS_02065 [Sulfuriferula sp.]
MHTKLARIDTLNAATQITVIDIALQLLRNAVAHGIEAPAERITRAKPPLGIISISLNARDSKEYELKVRDDGCGLLPDRIRGNLVHSGRYSAEQVAQWDDRQIIMRILSPDFRH